MRFSRVAPAGIPLLVCAALWSGCGQDDETTPTTPPPVPEADGYLVAIAEHITNRMNDLLLIAVYPAGYDWAPGSTTEPISSSLQVIPNNDFSIYHLMQEIDNNNQETGISKLFEPSDYSLVFFTINPGSPPDHFAEIRLHVNSLDSLDNTIWYQTVGDLYWTYWDSSNSNGDVDSYLDYEYWAATHYGPDGVPPDSGQTGDEYTDVMEAWQGLTWVQKMDYLPEGGFPYALDPTVKDDQYFLMIGDYDQFGSGWPEEGDIPANYRGNLTDWLWSADNSYRNTYQKLRSGCDVAVAPTWGNWTGSNPP